MTNIHGHAHQVLYNEIGKMRSIGMLATSWPWPYAPEGVPALTQADVRADPGDHFDGVGWAQLTAERGGQDRERVRDVAQGQSSPTPPWTPGTATTCNQVLSPRMADRL